MARVSKEHILSEIRRLAAENGGSPVGMARFVAETGVTMGAWRGRYWARWGDAIAEAGFKPNNFQGQVHADEDLARLLADVTRDLGRFPSNSDLRFRRTTVGDIPSDKVFDRLGNAVEKRSATLRFARQRPEYADVASLLSSVVSRPAKQADTPDLVVVGAVYLVCMGEFHKIGKSHDPGRRLHKLAIQLPEKHDLVHLIETDDPAGIESYWHRRFASQRTNGEWFRLSPEDVAAFVRRTYM